MAAFPGDHCATTASRLEFEGTAVCTTGNRYYEPPFWERPCFVVHGEIFAEYKKALEYACEVESKAQVEVLKRWFFNCWNFIFEPRIWVPPKKVPFSVSLEKFLNND